MGLTGVVKGFLLNKNKGRGQQGVDPDPYLLGLIEIGGAVSDGVDTPVVAVVNLVVGN